MSNVHELRQLEERLAFENACISIDCSAIEAADGWLELDAEDVERGNLVDELRYLELRGMLERHATDSRRIRLSADAAGLVVHKSSPEVKP